jgi:acyl carrier protein
MTDSRDTLTRLAALIADDQPLRPEQLRLETRLNALGIDSLAMVELLWRVEEDFGLRLPPDLPNPRTLGDVVAFIDRLQARQGLAAH